MSNSHLKADTLLNDTAYWWERFTGLAWEGPHVGQKTILVSQ